MNLIASNPTTKLTLFDLDHTLLPLDSDFAWGQFTTKIGWTNAQEFAKRNESFFADYQAGKLNVHDYVRFATQAVCEKGELASQKAHEQFMREVIEPAIRPEALDLIAHHQKSGDVMLIVTATNEFVTRPIARALGIENEDSLIAVNLVRDPKTNWFTGEIEGEPSMREGKVKRMEKWLAANHLNWRDVESTFYSDSFNDIPLLEQVNHPVATNPDARLRKHAQEKNWRILDLFDHQK